jgi:hypothetical protein
MPGRGLRIIQSLENPNDAGGGENGNGNGTNPVPDPAEVAPDIVASWPASAREVHPLNQLYSINGHINFDRLIILHSKQKSNLMQ